MDNRSKLKVVDYMLSNHLRVGIDFLDVAELQAMKGATHEEIRAVVRACDVTLREIAEEMEVASGLVTEAEAARFFEKYKY